MKSYMNDYNDTYVIGKNSARMVYKAGLAGCGIATVLVGAFISLVNVFAGIPLIIAGVAIAIGSILYFRQI